MKKGIVFIFIFVFLLIGIISADYDIGDDYFIEETYGSGDTLKGWINISLDDEWSNSIFESSVDGEYTTTVTLLELLKAEDFLYECSNLKCSSDYVATVEAPTKSFFLDDEKSDLFGFKFPGADITAVSNFSIYVESDANESTSPQLLIDVLNDGENVWQAHTASGDFGSKIDGCYIDAESSLKATITLTQYCQKFNIPLSPNVRIGAVLIGADNNADFVMTIDSVDSTDDSSGACSFPVSSEGEEGCVPTDFVVNKEQDYFVCIHAENSVDANKYEIDSENNNPCGFAGSFNDEFIRDYNIFIEPGEYDAVGSFTLDDEEINNIEGDIKTYLSDIYDGDCPSSGCIVPIKITSMVSDQTIDISNAVLDYIDSGTSLTTNNLYDLDETPAKINAEMQKLSIDAGEFAIPSDYDDYTISLKFKDEEIFSEEITVEKVRKIQFLHPLTTAKSYPTDFTVKADSDTEIKLYEWDFGNGDKDITTTNNVKYTYDARGTYNLGIRVVYVDNKSSTETFTITVGSASEVIGGLLQTNKINLGLIKNQLKNFSAFEQKVIKEALDINAIETVLNVAKTENEDADTEADYQAILQDLMAVQIPKMISLSIGTNSILFFPKKTNINIDVLTEIAGGSYESSKRETYANSILGWNVQNVDITLSHKEITSSFVDYNEPLLNIFEVEVTKKAGSEDNPYIILEKVEGLTFADDYSKEEISGYFYFPLIEESKKIVFATTEDINFLDLPLFVSPEISKLSLIDFDFNPLDESGKLKKWILFSLIMLLLVIIGMVFWAVLHTWYKKKYEDYLFKNKNNLYNLFTWIENSKKKGLSEGKLKSQLRKAGWNSEQLRYVLRKYSGKKTGMPDIPLTKVLKRSREKKSMNLGTFPGNSKRKYPRK